MRKYFRVIHLFGLGGMVLMGCFGCINTHEVCVRSHTESITTWRGCSHSHRGNCGNQISHTDSVCDEWACEQGYTKYLDGNCLPIENQIAQKETMQKKVMNLIEQGKTLDQIKAAFGEVEGRLIESMYKELQELRSIGYTLEPNADPISESKKRTRK